MSAYSLTQTFLHIFKPSPEGEGIAQFGRSRKEKTRGASPARAAISNGAPALYHQTGDVTHGPTSTRGRNLQAKNHLITIVLALIIAGLATWFGYGRDHTCRRPQRHGGRARRHRDGYARRRADRDVSRRRSGRLYPAAVRRAGHAHRRAAEGNQANKITAYPASTVTAIDYLICTHARRPPRRHAGRHRGLPGAHALQLRHLEQQRRVPARHARGRNSEPRHHRAGRGRYVRPRQRDRDRPRPAAALQRRQQPEPHPARGLRQQRLPLHRRRRSTSETDVPSTRAKTSAATSSRPAFTTAAAPPRATACRTRRSRSTPSSAAARTMSDGHPHDDTPSAACATRADVTVYRIDLNGTIVCRLRRGQLPTFTTEKEG